MSGPPPAEAHTLGCRKRTPRACGRFRLLEASRVWLRGSVLRPKAGLRAKDSRSRHKPFLLRRALENRNPTPTRHWRARSVPMHGADRPPLPAEGDHVPAEFQKFAAWPDLQNKVEWLP